MKEMWKPEKRAEKVAACTLNTVVVMIGGCLFDLLSFAPESNICRSDPTWVLTPEMHPSKLCSRQTTSITTLESDHAFTVSKTIISSWVSLPIMYRR